VGGRSPEQGDEGGDERRPQQRVRPASDTRED